MTGGEAKRYTVWLLRCTQCGRDWILPVSFNLEEMGRLYHFCPYCRENTFHIVVQRRDVERVPRWWERKVD